MTGVARGLAKGYRVWGWRSEQSGLSRMASFGVVFGGTVSASASKGLSAEQLAGGG